MKIRTLVYRELKDMGYEPLAKKLVLSEEEMKKLYNAYLTKCNRPPSKESKHKKFTYNMFKAKINQFYYEDIVVIVASSENKDRI